MIELGYFRVIEGIGEGVSYPAAASFWARWSPPHERSRMMGSVLNLTIF